MKRKLLNWTPAIVDFMKARAEIPRHQLAAEINQQFGTDFTYEQVRGFCKRNRIMTGRDGCFVKGQDRPAGSGASGPNATSFQKGHQPKNYLPVGSVRFTSDGYWQTKVFDSGYPPDDWVATHRLVWQLHKGPIPPGHKIIFIDGDSSNIEIDNLEMVSNGELAVINKRPLRLVHPEMRPAAITLGKLIHRAHKLQRESA